MHANAPKPVDGETESPLLVTFDIIPPLLAYNVVATVFGCVSTRQTPLECNGFPKIERVEERRTSDLGVTTLTLPYFTSHILTY